jgi:hypothetical protein
MARYIISRGQDQNHILEDSVNLLSPNRMFLISITSVCFDYECYAGIKFLVTNHANGKGFGEATKNRAIDQIYNGMATCRVVVLFMNHIPYGGPRDLQSPYRGSSCERNDRQCMFLPIMCF